MAIRRMFNCIGAGFAAYIFLGGLITGVDSLTGDHMEEAAMSFEEDVIAAQPVSEQNAFEKSILKHPGATLNLALFSVLFPAGAFAWSRLERRSGPETDQPVLKP